MSEIILYSAISLDGFIAGPDHELDWLPGPQEDGSDFGYSSFFASVEITVMGGTTWDVVQKLAPGNPYPDKRNLVFSRTPRVPVEGIEFISADPIETVTEINKRVSGNIWLVGGGKLNALFLCAGMIDRLELTVIPVWLGNGIPLFGKDSPQTVFSTLSAVPWRSGPISVSLKPER